MKLTDKKQINRLAYLCAFIYFISYITRINYSAVISEMVTSTGLSKSALSIALTGSFITYGAGQLVSGYFGDKLQPKKLISMGLLTSVIMNLLIPVCENNVQMTVVWCVNGLAQAFMWPPMVKLMSCLLSPEDYNRACVNVSRGSSFGTIFIYLAAPVFISFLNWESVFVMCAAMGAFGWIIWCKTCPKIEMTSSAKEKKKTPAADKANVFVPLVISVMLAIVLQGILRDGVTTWMPSFISETYNFSNEISILSGVFLPIFSIGCYQITLWLYSRKFTNPFFCATLIFATGAFSAIFLYLFSDVNALFSVFLMTVLNGCMHGANMIFTCIIPPILSRNGNVSVISGALNSCAYVGSAIAAYAIPLATESAGWSATLFLWTLIGVAGSSVCLLCVFMWRKRQ